MTFPITALPVTVEIAPGADPAADPGTWTWVDITSSVRLRERIHITQGRADEAARVDPSTCRLRLDNRTGNFTPRNPLGTWYGTLGRNTPLRVRIVRAQDTFTRTVSNGWGTSDSGDAWTTTGGAAADYSVNGTRGVQSLSTVNVTRESRLSAVSFAAVDITVGRLSISATPTGSGTLTVGLRARLVDASNFVDVQLFAATSGTVTIAVRQVVAGVATGSGFPAVSGVTATTPMSVRMQAIGSTLRAKAWASGLAEPAAWNVSMTTTHLAAGQVWLRAGLPAGSTNTLPVLVDYDNFSVTNDRFSGFVSSWPPRWDKSGRDATVPIEANGILRRLGQGTPPTHSAMWRTIAGSGPAAYWPGEDGTAAGWAASALAGHNPLTVDGTAQFRPESDYDRNFPAIPFGTSALPDLSGGASLTASVPGSATSATVTGWTAYVTVDMDTATASATLVVLDVQTPGATYVRWQLRLVVADTSTKVVAIDAAGAETVVINSAGIQSNFGGTNLSVWQSGGNIQVGLDWFPSLSLFSASGSVAGTLAGVTAVGLNPTKTTQTPPLPMGHLTLWGTHPIPVDMDVAELSYAFTPEAVHTRLARLCAEEGVALSIPAVSAAFETPMGPQPVATFLDLLYECADADVGVLYEQGFGLGYLPREHRYNRPVALALDFDAGQVAEPPEPTEDDQQLRNRITVSRRDGSSATAEDADSIAAVGLYDEEVTVNHADDTQLADHAAWRVHLGT